MVGCSFPVLFLIDVCLSHCPHLCLILISTLCICVSSLFQDIFWCACPMLTSLLLWILFSFGLHFIGHQSLLFVGAFWLLPPTCGFLFLLIAIHVCSLILSDLHSALVQSIWLGACYIVLVSTWSVTTACTKLLMLFLSASMSHRQRS